MCSRKRKSWATPVESKEVTVGMVWIHLDRWSTTTRMALYPFESGSSPIMSMEITCQCRSGTLLGISFPTFCVGKVFVWCRWDNNLPHESFVESSSRARMSYHNCPKSHLYSIM